MLTRDYAMADFPVFVRDGAIVPMNVERDYTGIGDKDSAGHVTYNLYPTEQTSTFELQHPDKSGLTTIGAGIYNGGKELRVYLDGVKKPHILRARLDKKPVSVKLDGAALAEGAQWRYDEAGKRLFVRTGDYGAGKYVVNF